VQLLDPKPGGEAPAPALAGPGRELSWQHSWQQLRRWFGRLRVAGRWLDHCLGARAGAWIARSVGLGFAVTALSLARPLPDAAIAFVRLSLVALSWCAGLAALSLAGPTLERSLATGRGLFENRGIPLAALRAERPLLLVRWTLRKLGVLVLLVLAACALATDDPWRASRLLELAAGAAVYLAALGAGLGAVAHVCHELGGERARAWLVGVVLLPELIAPAWPELPTLVHSYASLLNLCLGLGGPS
jgi:hypothetical protein